MANTNDYIESIIENLQAIKGFSYVDEAECLEVLKEVDQRVDTLRDYLEGK